MGLVALSALARLEAVVFRRWALEQVVPGDADPHPRTRVLLLQTSSKALQTRRFRTPEGEEIVVSEFAEPPIDSGIVYRRYQP